MPRSIRLFRGHDILHDSFPTISDGYPRVSIHFPVWPRMSRNPHHMMRSVELLRSWWFSASWPLHVRRAVLLRVDLGSVLFAYDWSLCCSFLSACLRLCASSRTLSRVCKRFTPSYCSFVFVPSFVLGCTSSRTSLARLLRASCVGFLSLFALASRRGSKPTPNLR